MRRFRGSGGLSSLHTWGFQIWGSGVQEISGFGALGIWGFRAWEVEGVEGFRDLGFSVSGLGALGFRNFGVASKGLGVLILGFVAWTSRSLGSRLRLKVQACYRARSRFSTRLRICNAGAVSNLYI